MFSKLNKATPLELEIWKLSTGVLGFGLGLLLAPRFGSYGMILFGVGLLVHLAAMARIYLRR